MLKADINELERLAGSLTTIGGAIVGLKVADEKVNGVVGAMPGSTVPTEFSQVSTEIDGAFLRVGQRMKDLATKVTTCAKDLHMTDVQFAQKMRELDFHK
ncbi:hypothetical protein [Nocardia macrotermitis]|uniref:Excreted virulence factor EspC (Type VII ESX diderm) n=1 Tax=Nocardia macrotermitis TaxID=2585198 RepID=A0A7K0DGC1_9NOCA|nr:hypothetical protein [Nocardia macrotermitis]MQY23834.1 hypothetical protein [Nocardia macrotermitis]